MEGRRSNLKGIIGDCHVPIHRDVAMIHRSVILSEAKNLTPLRHVLNSVGGVSSTKNISSIRAMRRVGDKPRPYA